MNDISKLYEVLFNTLQGLQDKKNPIDIERARAINETEIDFLKATGKNSATFFPDLSRDPVTNGIFLSDHGSKTVQALLGGTVTAHRMRCGDGLHRNSPAAVGSPGE